MLSSDWSSDVCSSDLENPGAIGARNSLYAHGMDLVPVPIDSQGIIVQEGLSRAPDFRLAFVTPSHQPPMGVTLSLARQIEIGRASCRDRVCPGVYISEVTGLQ